MSTLILVRHSVSRQDPAKPSHEWELTEEGEERCSMLADHLTAYDPFIFVTSEETKAIDTGRLTAELLGTPLVTAPNLHEHRRTQTPFYPRYEDFLAAVTEFFRYPNQLVMGDESADACFQRYADAVDSVISEYEDRTVALVSHGTVMSLFIGRKNNLDPLPFWKNFGMPAFVVLSLPSFEIVEIVNDITV
jgi:broad specificity phosphatase PhoE